MALLGRLVPEALLDAVELADEVQGLLRFPGLALFALGDVCLVELSARMGKAADETDLGALRGDGAINLIALGLQPAAVAFEQIRCGLLSARGLVMEQDDGLARRPAALRPER